eukprot:Tbor_TRINITY_DN5139_c6_g2::TRINITY_DN5139_c6_g2_i5::g.25733::m.25733/K09518/DNAJB12; DnaJ homolog subfamily B member 12
MSEDLIIIRRILQARNDYYGALGVVKTATVADIRRAYRKRALLLHPDKNNTTEATEAFKIINTAYSTLSDNSKRDTYDRYGASGVMREESGQRPNNNNYGNGNVNNRRYQYHHQYQNINVEDFFTAFFGGGVPVHRNQGRQYGPQTNNNNNHNRNNNNNNEDDANVALLMILPFLLFILIAFMLSSNILDIDTRRSSSSYSRYNNKNNNNNNNNNNKEIPPFSMRYSSEFLDKKKTTTTKYGENLNVIYYVKSDFNKKLKNNNINLE